MSSPTPDPDPLDALRQSLIRLDALLDAIAANLARLAACDRADARRLDVDAHTGRPMSGPRARIN